MTYHDESHRPHRDDQATTPVLRPNGVHLRSSFAGKKPKMTPIKLEQTKAVIIEAAE